MGGWYPTGTGIVLMQHTPQMWIYSLNVSELCGVYTVYFLHRYAHMAIEHITNYTIMR